MSYACNVNTAFPVSGQMCQELANTNTNQYLVASQKREVVSASLMKRKVTYVSYEITECNFQDPKKRSTRRRLHNFVCQFCGTQETPEYRRGPDGVNTLCNACGLQYAKEIKKQIRSREMMKVDFVINL